jgi:hypothetical protein
MCPSDELESWLVGSHSSVYTPAISTTRLNILPYEFHIAGCFQWKHTATDLPLYSSSRRFYLLTLNSQPKWLFRETSRSTRTEPEYLVNFDIIEPKCPESVDRQYPPDILNGKAIALIHISSEIAHKEKNS